MPDIDAQLKTYCDLLRGQGLSPVTIRHYREYIRRALLHPNGPLAFMTTITGKQWGIARAAIDWYAKFTRDVALSENIRLMIRPRKTPRKPVQIPDLETWRRLGQEAVEERPPFSCIIWLILYSGMRIGDILEITNDEIRTASATGRTTMHQKGMGHIRRRDWIPGPLCNDAVQWLAGIALAPDGKPTFNQLYQLVDKYRTHAEKKIRKWFPKPYHPHTFRHAVPSYLRELGYELEDIASITGHESLDTLRIYIQAVSPRRTIAAQDGLANLLFGKKTPKKDGGSGDD